ncbi:MAG: PilZ domain-containing protein, partial [Terriglobales bacterium]
RALLPQGRCTSQVEGRLCTVSEVGKHSVVEAGRTPKGYTDVQGAARFPIKLPVALKSGGNEETKTIETENISANGVLFRMDADVPIGSAVDFTISLPADVVGGSADVRVDCRGRVVRSFEEDGGRRGVGVVIDEYRFERA